MTKNIVHDLAVPTFDELPCLRCGAHDTTSYHLYDGSFDCSECGEGWSRNDVVEVVNKWQQVLATLDAAQSKNMEVQCDSQLK